MDKNIDFGFVADIYDDYVNVSFDVPFYKQLCGNYRGKVLELMCGTGRVSIPLADSGVRLTCVDYSREMLSVFAEKAGQREINLECQDICELDIKEKFELIFIPFNSFSEITDYKKRKNAIIRIYEHLTDEGDFFVTLYNPSYRLKSADGNIKCLGRFDTAENRSLIVTCYNMYDKASNLIYGTQFYEIYDSENRLIDKRFLNISFSLLSREEIIQSCTEAGFRLVQEYGDYCFGELKEDSMFMNLLFSRRKE